MMIEDQTEVPALTIRTSTDADALREIRRVTPDGEVIVVEKVPQTPPGVPRALRYQAYVRHDGHVGNMSMKSAAACDPNDNYGLSIRIKARRHGWYRPDQCPCALLATGELLRRHIVNKSIIDDRPCEHGTYDAQHPCKHSISERDARRAKHEAAWAAKAPSYQSEADKILGVQKEANALQREQNAQLTDLVKALMAQNQALMSQLAGAGITPAVPADPKKGK